MIKALVLLAAVHLYGFVGLFDFPSENMEVKWCLPRVVIKLCLEPHDTQNAQDRIGGSNNISDQAIKNITEK